MSQKVLFDFTDASDNLRETWGAVDDGVMGGVSESSMRLVDNSASFSGTVSTANSGGFASVRTQNFSPALDLSQYEGIKLHIRGDGQRYKFILRSETQWDGVGYCYSFDTEKDTWIDIQIPFNALIPVFRAKIVRDKAPLNLHQICSLQLMLSKFEYDGELNPKFESGKFILQVQSIQAYNNTL